MQILAKTSGGDGIWFLYSVWIMLADNAVLSEEKPVESWFVQRSCDHIVKCLMDDIFFICFKVGQVHCSICGCA